MRVYRGLKKDEVERAYSPSSMVGGDITPFLDVYARRSADARRTLSCHPDLAYGDGEGQKLDLFPGKTSGAPLFAFVHGGYWQELSRKDSAPMAAQVVAAGYAFAALDYTLAPQASIAEMVEEVARALAWLRRTAPRYGIDGTRLTVCGHSAGAHLAAMQMVRPPAEGTAPPVPDRLILISGIYDLEPIPLTSINDPLGLTADTARALSPLHQDPQCSPGVTVAVAEHDTPEFIRQSRDYADHLARHGVPVRFRLLRGLNHFDAILDVGFALDGEDDHDGRRRNP